MSQQMKRFYAFDHFRIDLTELALICGGEMRIAIVIILSLILQDALKSNELEPIGKPQVKPDEKLISTGQADERDPEDVKYEYELWKRLQGKYWRAENDPSKWPKFMRAKTTKSDPTRKDLWQVEAVYTIKNHDDCSRLATEAVSTYGGALGSVQVTLDEPICYFFVTTSPSSAELMSHDKRIRRVREVDDNFPPSGGAVKRLLELQPQPSVKPQSESEVKPKVKRP